MNLAFAKYKHSWFVVFCSAAILAIVVCNVWLLCCGRCVINDYLHVPPIGWLLILANLVAGIILMIVKRCKRTKPDLGSCLKCRAELRSTWMYCPKCGGSRSAECR